jgi:hypothetical protein
MKSKFKKCNVDDKIENPFNTKKLLGELIVTELYGEDLANKRQLSFENLTINKEYP